uniref:ATP synthase F0 subunit 8 n=1 Tax=Lamellidens marginalis TaxID=644998 RepID=UPI0020014C30|nr:ATP synthase F0 subunit 8 [Lamellidens marginalis]QTW91598.1 ATPase8 [Lamellidens marginalis]
MPQLSPMSWFLVFLFMFFSFVLFFVSFWWGVNSVYKVEIKHTKGNEVGKSSKWGWDSK